MFACFLGGFFSFSLTKTCLPCRLVGQAKRMLYSEQPAILLARRHLKTMLLTNFENVNSISNIFQETKNFVVLTNPIIICVYLRSTSRHFRDQGKVRHSTSKLLKCDLVETLNTFQNPSLRIFTAGKASLVFNFSRYLLLNLWSQM